MRKVLPYSNEKGNIRWRTIFSVAVYIMYFYYRQKLQHVSKQISQVMIEQKKKTAKRFMLKQTETMNHFSIRYTTKTKKYYGAAAHFCSYEKSKKKVKLNTQATKQAMNSVQRYF